MRTASIEHEGVTRRVDVDGVDNLLVWADSEIIFGGFLADGQIRIWELPDRCNDDAVCKLERALAAQEVTP